MANGLRERLGGLLGGQSTLGNLGIGLLAASGPRAQGTSNVGARIAEASQFASQRQQEAMRNDLIRQEMLKRKRQQEAQQQIQGLLGAPQREAPGQPIAPGTGPMATQDMRQGELMGLLAQASPDQFNAGLLGQMFGQQQERAEPAFVRELRAAGLDPATGEGQQILLDRLRNQDDGGNLDQQLRILQTQMAAFQLDEKRRERLEQERTESQQRAGRERAIQNNLQDVSKLADLNRDLEGTFLEAGIPASNIRRTSMSALNAALEAAGVDRTEQREQVAKFDRFRKGLNDLIINTIDRFGPNLTNQQLSLLENASASTEISPPAIASILADVAEINLQNAEIEGFELEPEKRRQYEELIERERNFQPRSGEAVMDVPEAARRTGEAARRTAVRAADIARMGVDQIRQLDFESMTEDQRNAIARRLDELGL